MAGVGGEFTQRLLVDAGIADGMRVLDIGCGSGDVALMVAALVGERGEVVGVDRDPSALAMACQRATEAGFANASFIEGGFAALDAGEAPFDAVVGRRVLMYQREPIESVAALAGRLRAGGLIAFQEHDASIMPASRVPMPLHSLVQGWMRETVMAEGANTHIGFDLHSIVSQAGLLVEEVRAEAIVMTAQQPYPAATIIRAMLPRILRHGVTSEQQIDINTLEARLAEERQTAGATYLADMMFGIWARKA